MINTLIPSFNTGELSPRLWSRVDLDKYGSGCRVLENFITMPYGGVNRRPGTAFIAAAKNSNRKARLIGFNFSTTTNFVLEFGHQYIRFYTGGAQVLSGGSPYEIDSPYAEADLFELQMVQINDVMYIAHANYPVYKLSRYANTNWTLAPVAWDYPAFRDENLSTTTITPSATTGTISLTASAATFDSGDVGGYYRIGHVRANSSITAPLDQSSSSTPIRILGKWEFTTTGIWTGDIFVEESLDSGTSWRTVREFKGTKDRNIITSGIQSGDALMRVTTVMAPAEGTATLTIGGNSYVKNLLYTGTYPITSGKVSGAYSVTVAGTFSGTLKIQSSPDGAIWTTLNTITLAGTTTGTLATAAYLRMDYSGTGASIVPYAYLDAVEATVYGIAKITAVASATSATATIVKPLYNTTATTRWAEGEWSTRRGFPRTVAFHQQRLWFGGNSSHAVTLWGSTLGDFENFLQTTYDDSSLSVTLSTVEQNAINWLVSHRNQLIVGTSGDEFVLQPANSGSTLTPTSLDVQRQSRYGSSYLQAALVNNAVLYTQRHSRKILELFYNFQIDGFVSQDLTLLSEHVTKGGVIQHAFQQALDPTLWVVTSGGTLAGMTYDRNQNVVSWHRHITDGTFESIAVVYGAGSGGGDELWAIVNRTVGGTTKRYVERFDPDYRDKLDNEDYKNWFYVDCGKSYSLGTADSTFSGLSHLEGKTVSVLADGAVHPDCVVASGSITLRQPAKIVMVGLPYTSTLTPTSLDIGQTPQGTAQGRHFRVHRLGVRFFKSLGGQYETAPGVFDPILFRDFEVPMGSAPAPFTGQKDLMVAGNFAKTADITLRQNQPLPMTILALIPRLDVYGD